MTVNLIASQIFIKCCSFFSLKTLDKIFSWNNLQKESFVYHHCGWLHQLIIFKIPELFSIFLIIILNKKILNKILNYILLQVELCPLTRWYLEHWIKQLSGREELCKLIIIPRRLFTEELKMEKKLKILLESTMAILG